MVDLLNTRITQLYDVYSGKWLTIDGINVKQGDIIRMFEPDGTPVYDGDTTVFICQNDARYNENGVIVIEYEYNGI